MAWPKVCHVIGYPHILLHQHIVNLWYSLFFSPYHHPPHQILGQGEKSYIKLSTMLLGRAGNIHWNMMSFLPIVDITRIIEFWRDLVGMRYSMCNFTTFSLPVVQVPSSRSFLTTHRLLCVIISISFSLRPRSLLLFGKMYFFLLRVHVPIFVTSWEHLDRVQGDDGNVPG